MTAASPSAQAPSSAPSPSAQTAPTPAAARKSVVVFDYGSGNVHSAVKALEAAGADVELTADPSAALAADGLLVPGVGSFGAVMEQLLAHQGDRIIDQRLAGGRAVLGICVGMQVMFEWGVEGTALDEEIVVVPGTPTEPQRRAHARNADAFWWEESERVEVEAIAGLGEWPGAVRRLDADVLPHMGWNRVEAPAESRLFRGISDERFYFVHSYAATRLELDEEIPHARPILRTTSVHGETFLAAVENGPLSATQFHPEKSGEAGIQLLRNWLDTLT